DFSRLFVATPNLRRSHLVLTARHRRGAGFVERVTSAMAADRGKSATFESDAGGRTAPWYSRGPTPRVIRALPGGQLVIARAPDVGRIAAVGAALSKRHARQPGMERATGAAALLSMYEGEAVALSVEGVATYVPDDVDFAPRGLRLSLRHLDEYHATLIAYGYYRTAAQAEYARGKVDELRRGWIDHPRAKYLGLDSALEDAILERRDDTLTLRVKLTLHQTRYLLDFVSRVLDPRG
ncbi:MAG: hypothetical protein PVI30_26250, partial [Myxococcales bacterium]